MTVNLMQVDEQGREHITSLFQDPEEREFMAWIMSLEMACPGVTIFIHRLSDRGHYLCQVPAAHEQLVISQQCPPRYCGCLTCMRQRVAIRDLTAWNITPTARAIAHEYLAKVYAMQGAQDDGIEGQI
jgi:hypothetical protein